MIKYIGSKRLIVPAITIISGMMRNYSSALDLFSGTSRVGHALKKSGMRVIANDHNAYAMSIAQCYVESDRAAIHSEVKMLVDEMNSMTGEYGYFTRTFCDDSRFFQPKNGRRIDRVRRAIFEKGLPPIIEGVMLTALMEAADRVDSTCGLQMAYLKNWSKRSFGDMHLRVPDMVDGKGSIATRESATEASHHDVDLAYLDPPYNQHKYLGNYHIWETLVLNDEPTPYGIAMKREDCRERHSAFNSKRCAKDELRRVIDTLNAKNVLVSFSDEGHIRREDICDMLKDRESFSIFEIPYARHVGAKIGIHSPNGGKVGVPGKLKNIETLFLAGEAHNPEDILGELNSSAMVRGSRWTMRIGRQDTVLQSHGP